MKIVAPGASTMSTRRGTAGMLAVPVADALPAVVEGVVGDGTGVADAVPAFRDRTNAAVPQPTRSSAPSAAVARISTRRVLFLSRGMARMGDGAVSTAGCA